MDEIKIKCPACGVALKVKMQEGLESKVIPCPVCHVRNKYVDYIPNNPAPKPAPKEDLDHTVRPGANLNLTDPGTLVDMATGRRYDLVVGTNRIGRACTGSMATLQIPSPDRKLSRQHTIIEVRAIGGGQYQRSIQNWANTNPTLINNTPLENGDVMQLLGGEIIQMANLRFRLEI